MANLEIGKNTQTYQQASAVFSANTVTITISNTVGLGGSSSFLLGSSRVLGLRYSTDAAGLVPALVGSTAVPAPFYIKSITSSAAAGSASSVAVVIQSTAASVAAYAWLVWVNETAASSSLIYPA